MVLRKNKEKLTQLDLDELMPDKEVQHPKNKAFQNAERNNDRLQYLLDLL